MEQQEILEGNKLITEFMGAVLHERNNGDYRYPDCGDGRLANVCHPSRMLYHEVWGWLMPVVEKIESLPINPYKQALDFGDIDGDIEGHFWFRRLTNNTEIFINVYFWQVDRQISGLIKEFEGHTPISSLYLAVVAFIQWYNTQTQQP